MIKQHQIEKLSPLHRDVYDSASCSTDTTVGALVAALHAKGRQPTHAQATRVAMTLASKGFLKKSGNIHNPTFRAVPIHKATKATAHAGGPPLAKPTPTKKPRDLAAVLEEIEGHATAAADAVSQARAQAALVVQSMASASRVIDDAVRQAKVSRDAIQSLTAEAVSLGGMADDDRAALQMLIARYGNE